MKNNSLHFFILSIVLLFGIWLRTSNITSRYGFEWDQSDDAVKVMKMVNGDGFTLLGPRVAGPDSFFVPAWHYYFLVPFFWLANGSPWAGYAASLAVGILSIIVYYFVARKLWGMRAGLVAAWGGAMAYSTVSWNVMYTVPLSAIIFYIGYKMFDNKKLVPLGIVVAFFAGTTHLVAITLLGMVLIGVLIMRNKPTLKSVLISLIVGSLSLMPLVIFDFRHAFHNAKKFVEFVSIQANGSGSLINTLALKAYYNNFSFTGGSIPFWTWQVFEKLFLIFVVLKVIFWETDRYKKLWLSMWFLLPAALLIFYHNNIPGYYFGVPVALIPLFVSKFSNNYFVLIFLFCILISGIQTKRILSERLTPSLEDKTNIVKFMISHTGDKKFNFSYNVPYGQEVGYSYLFTWLKKEPTYTDDSRLYTLTTMPAKPDEKIVYEKAGLGIIER